MRLEKFLQQRYVDFRWGFNYLTIPLSIVSNITVIYYLLVVNTPLHQLFPHFTDFSVYGSLLIVALSIALGQLLFERGQLKVDTMRNYRIVFDEFRKIVREELDKK